MSTECCQQLTFWKIGQQEVSARFDGGRVVSDAGLLSLRAFEKKLGVLSELAQRLPDPRAQKLVTHSRGKLLTQRVYQILAGYPDCQDAQSLRVDPLFRTVLDVPPDNEEDTLASGSTLARYHYAYTRRQAQLPVEERPVLLEQQAARNKRLRVVNDYLVELFIRTRRQRPTRIVIDLDATDDPTHGQQVLSFFHGYFEQYQYFPLLAFDGDSGFPLAAWLRPGTVHASCGAVSVLQELVPRLRQAWPDVEIVIRGDSGLAVPELYEYCDRQGLNYAIGYATNEVLKERTDTWLADLQEYYHWYGRSGQTERRYELIADYQAGTWDRPRRIVAKLEVNALGTNRRFVVTNLGGSARSIYQEFYVQRGDVPESPIGELKKGLAADRLSAHGFRANSLRFLEHVIAYALVVLYREAAASVPEVAKAEVSTLRQRLWKVGAIVRTSARRIWFHFSQTWPHRPLWVRVHQAVMQFIEQLPGAAALPGSASLTPM